ncbi:MAG: DUF4124 domain-containing protein [Burkholderiales bacterium PBB4]|nr:MAG: DUF4124 domain-containing protein [Burkholderiales bacterium PBB4]
MKTLKKLFACGLVLACTVATAQWQWLDKDGRKVFSDRAPPSDVPEKNILKRPNGRVNPPPAAETAAAPSGESATTAAAGNPAQGASAPKGLGIDKELEAKKKQAADAEAAKRKAEEEKITKSRIENCARAKEAKAGLDSGIRISRVNAAGEREVMDEAARAAEAKRIQGIMATECK